MPKKTREQKMKSMERRLTRLEQAPILQPEGQQLDDEPSTITTPVFRLPNLNKRAASASQQKAQAIVITDAKAVQSDIVRIILLTTGVLGIEFFLYWLIEIRKVTFNLF